MSNDQSSNKPGTFQNDPVKYSVPWTAVREDPAANNSFIANLGICFQHWVAIPNVLGAVQTDDARDSFGQAEKNQFDGIGKYHVENGFIYVCRGLIYGIFQGNSKSLNHIPSGLYSDDGAQISMNRYYKDSEKTAGFTKFDKLVPHELPSEFFHTTFEKFIHNPAGIDRLQYHICKVDTVIDSAGIIYNENEDFVIERGNIRWLDTGKRPGFEPATGNGRVVSIRYTYKPYYYVKYAMHDIRVQQSIDELTGEVMAKKGPILLNVQADWVFLDARTTRIDDVSNAQLVAQDGGNIGIR